MAMFNRMQVGLKPVSTHATVADDPTAKLMYYLNCMCHVLSLDDDEDINRLRRFDEYSYLNHTDRNVLINMCYLLSPDVLMNKCIFQDDALCGNMANAFYDLETLSNTLVVAGSVMIGGQQKRVTKIMAFKISWLQAYWEQPMKELIDRQKPERRQMMSMSQTGRSCAIL